ncbi:uncharacterized protein LOC123709026 [Pieris brassicae]|uniref:uncharacterized protein LOC123709026 n=1 Tax=Pieris brassicae TaxID=7116 RepID=UPI001E65EF4B|nr:uncharacterized protein LOC123709026 [Pieris brassicae]
MAFLYEEDVISDIKNVVHERLADYSLQNDCISVDLADQCNDSMGVDGVNLTKLKATDEILYEILLRPEQEAAAKAAEASHNVSTHKQSNKTKDDPLHELSLRAEQEAAEESHNLTTEKQDNKTKDDPLHEISVRAEQEAAENCKIFTSEELSQSYFMPKKLIKNAMRYVNQVQSEHYSILKNCRQTLLDKQLSTVIIRSRKRIDTMHGCVHWRVRFLKAINTAIYSHDWNKLLYILRKSPIDEHINKKTEYHYIRALTILLMNHPYAKSQSLLNHYFHMVLSCRSDQDKKALYKVLLTMPDKLMGFNVYNRLHNKMNDTEKSIGNVSKNQNDLTKTLE